MTAAAIDLSPREVSAEELERCKEFLVESWSPWRSSVEQQHLTSLLRYVGWLQERLERATRTRWGGVTHDDWTALVVALTLSLPIAGFVFGALWEERDERRKWEEEQRKR